MSDHPQRDDEPRKISGMVENLLEDLMDRDRECLRASANGLLYFLNEGAKMPVLSRYSVDWAGGRSVSREGVTTTVRQPARATTEEGGS